MIDLRPYLTGAAIGALLLYIVWSPRPEVHYDTVTVTRTQIEEREPQVEVRFVDRIRTVTVEPEIVARSEGGGETNVQEFCAQAVVQATTPDSVTVPVIDPVLLLRSGSLDDGWFFRPGNLTLTGPLSNGGLQQQDYRVRGGYSFVVNGDSVIVRQDRFWWVKEAIEVAAPILLWEGAKKVF